MDFWSRLLSPLSSGSSRKDQAKDPAKRLHRFEKEYGLLLQAWRNASHLTRDSDAAETLEIRLQELTNILSDESRRPLPHPCIQYASLKNIYVPIGKIATTSYNEWIIKEAVLFFATLIESEEEAFVENPTFSGSLTNLLVRITGVNSVRLGLDTESRVVELAFNITTKIRLNPEILPAWFKTQHGGRGEGDDDDLRERFAGRTQRGDFPLFYILMDYIHHEGKVGDFARTGLLYIIEAASSSGPLEQWIVESDLSTLMATGLGALYSQLSRKLVIDHPPHDLPPILALSDYQHPASSYEIISSCSPEFQSHLETFLSHLLFWQDVLNHCRSVEVKSTLLEHFQVIFLQQLLYPSLLESSDIDGGSSVAVLTYLRRILESLDHPDMINLILHYLLALPNALPYQLRSKSSVSDARQRKSMDLASMMAERSDVTVTPLLFNLVDLILACLRSQNQQTIHVTLQLVSAILKRHHRYAVITLLKTEILPPNNLRRTIGAHEQEVEYIMSLASSIGGQTSFDDIYQEVLRDTMGRLENHPCSIKMVAPRISTSNQRLPDSLPGAPKDVTEHTLRPDDPLLNSLLDLLETFFINPVETNLSVTETLVDLAVCGYMRIEGWLIRNPRSYTYYEADVAYEKTEAETQPAEVQPAEAQPTDAQPAKEPAPPETQTELITANGGEVESGAEIKVESVIEDTQIKTDGLVEAAQKGQIEEAEFESDSKTTSDAQHTPNTEIDSQVQSQTESQDEARPEPKVKTQTEVEVNGEAEAANSEEKPQGQVPEAQVTEAQDEAKLEAQVEPEKPVESNETTTNKDKEESADASPSEVPEVKKLTEPKEEEKEKEAPHAAELEQVEQMKKCREWPKWSQASAPRVMNVLKHLEDQVLTYKKTLPRFDELVQQRREAFQTADAMLQTPQPSYKATPIQQDTPDRSSFEDISRSASPSRPSALEGLAHRLLSELGTPSRSSSPRGRKELNRSSASGGATPSSKPNLTPNPELSHHHLDRRNLARSSSPSKGSPNKGRDESYFSPGREAIVSSQVAAFAAIDQTILARKVGLPHDDKVEPIPIKFDREPISEPVEETDQAEDESEPLPEEAAPAAETTVSVSHLVTNVIILQSFLFELASLVQVRAGLFDEVRFI